MEFFFFVCLFFFIARYLLTILTNKQCMILTLLTELYSTYKKSLFTMWDTYATNNTILYLQYKKLAILTYNEILTLLTVLYSTLYIYPKKRKNATCTTYITDYIRYKNIHVNVHTKGNKKDHWLSAAFVWKTSLLSFESREGKQSLRKEMYSEQKRVFRLVHLS